jgi:hypothetical protein
MSRMRVALRLAAGVLVAVAAGSLGLSAGASGATAPALKWCAKAPAGEKGLWSIDTCDPKTTGQKDEVGGAYAWAWADTTESTFYCVLGGASFEDELCEHSGSHDAFLEVLRKVVPPSGDAIVLLSILKSKIAGAENIIDCTGGNSEGKAASATLAIKLRVTYTGCSSVKPSKCEVSNKGGTGGTINTEDLVVHLLSLRLVLYEPEASKAFVELEYKNKGTETCALNKEVLPVEGSGFCEGEGTTQLPAIEHLLICKASGSLLKLGASTATYEGVNHVHLEASASGIAAGELQLPYWKIQ